MAETKNGRKDAVSGSLAYDFESPEFWPEELYPREPDRKIVIPAAHECDEEQSTRAKVKSSQSVSPTAVVGYICAAVMLVLLLMAKIQLTAVTDEAVGLERELAGLNSSQSRLLIDYETAFNLSEIEEYATGTLGMQRPRDDQIYYIEGTVPDRAEVLEKESSGGFFKELKEMLVSVGEYFK